MKSDTSTNQLTPAANWQLDQEGVANWLEPTQHPRRQLATAVFSTICNRGIYKGHEGSTGVKAFQERVQGDQKLFGKFYLGSGPLNGGNTLLPA